MRGQRLRGSRSATLRLVFALFPQVQELHQVSWITQPITVNVSTVSSVHVHVRRVCVPQCPRGFWGDRRRCKKCFSSCESCTGSRSDQCSSCQEGRHLVEDAGTCTDACGDGYYLDHGNQPASRNNVSAARACVNSAPPPPRCQRLQEVQPELPHVHLRQHLHPLQRRHEVEQRLVAGS